MTPEEKQRIQARAALQQRCEKSARKAKKMAQCSAVSKSAWVGGMRRMKESAACAPAQLEEESKMAQVQMSMIQRQMSDEAVEELDDSLLALEAEGQVSDDEMSKLLEELRLEPGNDNERIAKFGLYEKYLETVENIRRETHEFWDTCKADFSGASEGEVQRQLRAIDSEQHMGIEFSETRWFVFDMTRRAASNNDIIAGVLAGIRTKLELLGRQDECPICLESLEEAEVEVLGCCHKTCAECWSHWRAARGTAAFCPLCKHEEFLQEVLPAAE